MCMCGVGNSVKEFGCRIYSNQGKLLLNVKNSCALLLLGPNPLLLPARNAYGMPSL